MEARQAYDGPRTELPAVCVILFVILSVGLSGPAFAQSSEEAPKIQELIQQGNLAGARQLVSAALQQEPQDAILLNLDGVIKAQQGDCVGAEASFRRAMALAPSFSGSYLNLGHLYQAWKPPQPGLRDKAIGVYEELLKRDPGNVEANYQSAALLMQKGQYAASLHRLASLPIDAQNRAQALSVRCADEAGRGALPQAEQAADRMLHSSDLADADVMTLVPILKHPEQRSLAVKLLEGLRQRNMATIGSLTSLALLYKQAGNLDDARKTLEQAAQIPPISAQLLVELARVANDQKDYTGALGYLAHARELEPGNASIHFFWGMVCVQMNLAEEAFQGLKKAVDLDPNNPYYNYAMGAVASEREEAREAVPYFQKYCQLKPHDPRGALALGSAHFAAHDDDEAEKIIAPVVNNPVTAARAHYLLGRIANHRGNYAQAITELQWALKAQPEYADAYAERGLVYLKQKDYPHATANLRHALELDPDNYTANMNLLVLYRRTNDPKAEEQAKRFEQIRQLRAQRVKEALRTIQVQP